MKTKSIEGYKVHGQVLIPHGVGPRKAYLLRPGYLKTPVTTLWHKNANVPALLPYLVKTKYNETHFTWKETFRGENQKYRKSIWPMVATYQFIGHSSLGGYPLLYITADSGTLCAKCATEQATRHDIDWPKIIGVDAYYEGPPVDCDNCNASIESAYGDPDNKCENPGRYCKCSECQDNMADLAYEQARDDRE